MSEDKKDLVHVPNTDVLDKADDFLEKSFNKTVSDKDLAESADNVPLSGRELLNKKNIEVKTELSDSEIVAHSKVLFIADRYDVPVLKDFSKKIMELKVSRMRKGRREAIESMKAEHRRQEGGVMSRLSEMFGFGGDKQ